MKLVRIEVAIKDRPNCIVPGCTNKGQLQGHYRNDGYPIFRKHCHEHHLEYLASKNGFDSVLGFVNSRHPYKRYRKDYCENEDGSVLGFECTTTIHKVFKHLMLDVDHIDGDPINNRPENLQTLCKCCHSIKTNLMGDYNTPGRKTLKVKR